MDVLIFYDVQLFQYFQGLSLRESLESTHCIAL